MCACSCDSVSAVFVPVDKNVAQVIVQAELKQHVTRTCDGPSVFVMMSNDQSVIFSAVLEFPVVVGASSGTILDAVHKAVVVHHLMQ